MCREQWRQEFNEDHPDSPKMFFLRDEKRMKGEGWADSDNWEIRKMNQH